MFWLLLNVAQIWFGFEFSLIILHREVNFFTIISNGISFGISSSVLIYSFFSQIFGNCYAHLVAHTILLIMCSIFLFLRRRRKDLYVIKLKTLDVGPPLILSIIVVVFTFPLYFLSKTSYLTISSTFINEDLSLISSFTYGCNSGKTSFYHFKHPDYYGNQVVTRWLTSYFVSMLKIGGCGVTVSMVYSTTLLLQSLFLSLSSFCTEFRVSNLLSPIVILFPLFNSGIGYIKYLYSPQTKSPTIDYISDLGPDFPSTHCLNPLFQIILNSREMILSLAISTNVLYFLYRSIRCFNYKDSINLLRFSGFLIGGILPTTMHQCFISILIFSIFYCIIQCIHQKFIRQTKNLFISIIISFVFINLSRYYNKNFLSSIKFERIYHQNVESGDSFPILKYWFNNSGIYPFVIIFIGWILFGIVETRFFEAFVLTFITLNFIKLQDNEDYNIFGFYSFLYTIGSIYYMSIVTRIYKKIENQEAKGIVLGIIFVVTLFFFLSSLMSLKQIVHITNNWSGKFDFVNWVLTNTNKNDVFLSNEVALNPIPTCAGRIMYLSNMAVLEREGFNYGQAFENRTCLLRNSKVLNIVKYFAEFNGLQKTVEYNNDDLENWEMVYRDQSGVIYRNKLLDV